MFFDSKKKIKILLVDDDLDILVFMKLALKGEPYEIHTAPDAIVGLQLLKTKGPFDILITDIMMPEMNGVVFLEHVKVFYPDLKIAVCSAGGNQLSDGLTADELLELSLERGALRALKKPFSQTEFQDLIKFMVNHQIVSLRT